MIYRVNHYYPDDKKYDHLDFAGRDKAIAHYKKSRTATEIYEVLGGKLGKQINPRTGEPI